MSKIKPTIPFNFDDLYSNVQAKFIEKGYDAQEGSNTSQLITAMTYLISMLNTNTAVNINENLLTLARKRKNVLQDARLLGYEPGNKVSYQYELELTLPGGNFILPKYTEFVSGDKKYYYLGDLITIPNATAGYKVNIVVKEGKLIKSTDNSALDIIIQEMVENNKTIPQYYVDIPFTDVEDDGVEVFVTYYDDDGILFNQEQWYEIPTFSVDSDTILNKQFYRMNMIDYNTPRLYFKLPNTGDNLRLGTKIQMNILQSSGSLGALTGDLTTTLDCTISKTELKIQGTEEETIESIKYNAPLFWNSANRAVTKNDYKSICERLTLVGKSYIWDGNDEYPKVPGKIWFSFIPGTHTREFLRDAYRTVFELNLLSDEVNWFLEQTEINDVFNYLDVYKIPTLELLHRHPVFLDFEFNIEILKYNITSSESAQNETIFDIVNDFFGLNELYKLEDFKTEFFKSNLIKKIDSQVTDITGVNLEVINTITLYNKNIINESVNKKILIPLGLPYDSIYDLSGDLIVANLPSIDTTNFYPSKNLTVDWTGLTVNASEVPVLEANVKLGTNIIGKYTIFNSKYILVTINIAGVITEANIDKKVMSVKYKNDNIQIVKNTIPRLRKINFI